jgi:hypothetical protein
MGSTLLAPTPDGFKLLAVHANGIDVIHNGTGKVLRTLPHPSGRYDWKGLPIKQNIDGSLLAIPSLRQAAPKIYLIHTGTGKIIRTINLVKNGQRWTPSTIIGSIGFSDNKRLLAYTLYHGGKGTLFLYDISKQQAVTGIGITNTTDTLQEMLHFNRNNKKIVISAINQHYITLVDIEKRTQKTLAYSYSCFADFSADNKRLFIVQSHKNLITIKYLVTGKQQQLKLPQHTVGHFSTVTQGYNKALLALPLHRLSAKDASPFLVINTRTGKVLR